MKKIALTLSILFSVSMIAQVTTTETSFEKLPFGAIKPTGWLKTQMQNDMSGFVGNLNKLVPDLINDPIYGEGRLHAHSKAKDLGNMKEGDAEGDEQYKWWNSETQSNWWDAYIRNAFLLDDKEALQKVQKHIDYILSTQDADGYIGIYTPELRYHFKSENGELWSKATLYRGLLAYYEATGDDKVWSAIVKAVDNVMANYPIYASQPFDTGTQFNGGVSHGLTFTDVLDRMYQLTEDRKYKEYAVFLYDDFNKHYQSEKDVQLNNILNPEYKLQSHGVHAYEHLRPLLTAAYYSNKQEYQKALSIYTDRIAKAVTPTGGAIGDEWIAERTADATHTGYEYCSLHELLDSYTSWIQKSGQSHIGDATETLFYNAAQGSRDPHHSCIAYLKTDNSFEMLGTKNGEQEPDRKQTRYKYSPAHQDVAVCCNPNAGRISPYFIQSSWMKEKEDVLVATLLMPNVVNTSIKGQKLQIENKTSYPYENSFDFIITTHKPISFTLKIRQPEWVSKIVTTEKYTIEEGYIVFNKTFKSKDQIKIKFEAQPETVKDTSGNTYFRYGALFYAKDIASEEIKGKTYAEHFSDYTYKPLDTTQYKLSASPNPIFEKGRLKVNLINTTSNKKERVELIPLGKTVLRQVGF